MESKYKIATYVLVYGVVGTIISYVVFGSIIMISFLLGLATAMMNYSLLLKSTRRILEMNEGSQRGYAIRQSILRFSIFAVILYISSVDARFDIIATFVGMISVKVVYYVYFLINREV